MTLRAGTKRSEGAFVFVREACAVVTKFVVRRSNEVSAADKLRDNGTSITHEDEGAFGSFRPRPQRHLQDSERRDGGPASKIVFRHVKSPEGYDASCTRADVRGPRDGAGRRDNDGTVGHPELRHSFHALLSDGVGPIQPHVGVSLFQCPIVVGQALTDMVNAVAAVDLAASSMIGTTLADMLKIQKLGGFLFPRQSYDGELMLRRFSVAEDTHKG